MTVVSIVVIALLFWMAVVGTNAAPSMGPADFIIKHNDKCKWSLPTFIDISLRLFQRHGKIILSMNATFPHKLGDNHGIQVSVDVKRNGGWKPNFFKARGRSLCTTLKVVQPKFFALAGKSLSAHEPYSCPLPAGYLSINEYTPDMGAFQNGLSGDVLPYGEFRVHNNITLKDDVVACMIFYFDIVPKKSKKNG